MQDDLIFIFNVGVGLVPTLSAFRGQPQGIAPTISSQSHATPVSFVTTVIKKMFIRFPLFFVFHHFQPKQVKKISIDLLRNDQ